MRKAAVVALVLMASVVFAANVLAESGVKEECVTLCKDAAAFMNEKGFYPTVFEINRKGGKFVSKNTYVFLMDLEGHMLAHPFNQQYIGMDMKPNKDVNGTLFVQDYLKIANSSNGQGWTEYMYPTPEELKRPVPRKEMKASKKVSYVYRVPGKDLMMIAGFFE